MHISQQPTNDNSISDQTNDVKQGARIGFDSQIPHLIDRVSQLDKLDKSDTRMWRVESSKEVRDGILCSDV